MLGKIKILLKLSDNSADDILQTLIDLTQDEVKEYCNTDDLAGLDSAIIQIVIFKYNQLGSEGITEEDYSNVKQVYATSYPDSIMRVLNRHRRLKVL